VTGSFPLRVADILFTNEAVVVPEYDHLTPVFGLLAGGTERASERARKRYREDGLAGLVEAAERVHRVPYDDVSVVRLSVSRIARPKLAVEPVDAVPYAYRVHAPIEVDPLFDALQSLGDRRGFDVERRSAIGYDPVESVRRFLARR
jgi:hypothetical protein